MTQPINRAPDWRSYMATGNPTDIVSSPEVARELGGKIDAQGGQAANLAIDGQSTLAQVQAGSIVADAHLLRQYGARFDGVTDDAPAFNAVIKEAAVPAGGKIPSIAFILPAATILLKSPVISGNQNVSIRGQGAQNTVLLADPGNTGGVWQHGSSDAPSSGYVEISAVMLDDLGEVSSKTTAVNCHFDGTTAPTLRINEVVIRGFYQGLYLENPPRDVNVINLTVHGPDFALQPGAGISVVSTETKKGVFTTSWINCNVFNYTYGWRFSGDGMIEGNRFIACTSYNGWAFLQAVLNPAAISGLKNYQGVLWDFHSCDWQGYGYALDMKNCRGVRVRGGFYTFNDRTTASGTSLPAPWGQRASSATNCLFSFQDCADVLIEGVQFDVPASNKFSDTALVYFDEECTHCRIKNNAFLSGSPLYCGVELGSTSGNDGTPANTMIVSTDNRFILWQGGDKVLDHAGKQVDGPWISDQFLGTVTDEGVYEIGQTVVVSLVASTLPSGQDCARATVNYPKRRSGKALFIGGPPTVVFTVNHALVLTGGPYQLGTFDNNGFDVLAPPDRAGLQLSLNYRVKGL